MVKAWLDKLRSQFPLSLSDFGSYFHLAMIVVAAFVFIIGVPIAWSMVTSGKIASIEGVWALMIATFFGGFLYKDASIEVEKWQSKTVIESHELVLAEHMWNSHSVAEHQYKNLPRGIGLAVFAVVLLFNCGFSFSEDSLRGAVGPAFMAWGAFALIVQAPWSADLRCSSEKRATKRSAFTYYVLEAKSSDTGKWERLHMAEDLSGFKGPLEQYRSLRVLGKYSDMRMTEESGMRQVRMTFS